ncbi:MAG: hypothetical protein ACPHJ3_06980 [Rubripirellula sp.]
MSNIRFTQGRLTTSVRSVLENTHLTLTDLNFRIIYAKTAEVTLQAGNRMNIL